MLKAIFYARFHPERGPSVIHQHPNGSILPQHSSKDERLVAFSHISSYVIPPYELCNRPLSTCIYGLRVLGFPVSLEDPKYERNRFTFNVCFMLDEDEDARPWEQIVRKTAGFFRRIEEEDGILQAEEDLKGLVWAGDEGYPARNVGVVHRILRSILNDLNTYEETCIRLSKFHVLNLRRVPTKNAPPKVRAWDVPLVVRPLPDPEQWTWDLTLQRIYPYIDGIKHVQRIAEFADVELKLVKRAVRELLYHDRVILLDIFHFQAVYSLTADFAYFISDMDMQDECCKYIAIDPSKNTITRQPQSTTSTKAAASRREPILELYRHLSPGISMYDFVLAHEHALIAIDIRRFITFGVIKGFIRRLHKYAIASDSHPSSPQKHSGGSVPDKPRSNEDAAKEIERAWKKAALTSGWPTPPMADAPSLPDNLGTSTVVRVKGSEGQSEEEEQLSRFLGGRRCCLDEICVAMRMSEKQVVEMLRSGRFGDVVLFCK